MSKYRVQQGDSLWNIADKILGDGSRYKDIMDANNLTEKSIIYSGQILNIPDSNLNNVPNNNLLQYTIQSGDTLSEIAQNHKTTPKEILKINNINNPNLIRIGQILNLPKQNRYTPSIKNFKQIKQIEENINKGSDLDIINAYHKQKQDGQIYLVDDKRNNKLSVYRNGELLKSYKAIHGKNKESDDMTITYTDNTGKLINLAGNLSTPAGVYFTTKGNMYHGAPSFIRRTKEQIASNNPNGIPSSIHARTIYEGANTNGCTGMSEADLKDLAKYVNTTNVPTYILPADSRNRFFIRNGQLQFKSYDIQKTPSYNTIVSKPIKKITYNTQDLTDINKNIIKQFSQALINNKASLQKDLGINNDTYNQLVIGALGILGVESGYGNENTAIGNFLRATRKAIFRNNSSPDYKSKFYTYGIDNDNNSIGLTQIRFSYLDERERKLFNKYKITKESLVNNPEKAAIATLIKLAQSYLNRGHNIDKAISGWNQKPSYLNQVKRNMQRFNLYEMYKRGGILPIGTQQQYNNVVSIYQSLISKGIPPQAALEIVNQKVAEKGWTGYTTGDNQKYSTADEFTDHIIDWHGRMYPDSLKANNFEDYWKSIQITPKHKYNSQNPNYRQELLKTRPGVKKRINHYRQQQGLPLLSYMDFNTDNNIV